MENTDILAAAVAACDSDRHSLPEWVLTPRVVSYEDLPPGHVLQVAALNAYSGVASYMAVDTKFLPTPGCVVDAMIALLMHIHASGSHIAAAKEAVCQQ